MKYLLITMLFFINPSWAGYALYDYNKQEYIDRQETEQVRSIASITKLFTALTVVTSGVNLDTQVTTKCNSRGLIQKGSTLSIKDLLVAALVVSDNCAAETLADTYPGGKPAFLFDRRILIRNMGLKNTSLHDATGLSVFNVSTINDLITFAPFAYQNDTIREISNLPQAQVTVWRKGRSTNLTIKNTNPAVFNHSDIALSKTGTTNAAGRCVIMLVKRVQETYAVIVLGEPNLKARTRQVEKLLAYNETNPR